MLVADCFQQVRRHIFEGSFSPGHPGMAGYNGKARSTQRYRSIPLFENKSSQRQVRVAIQQDIKYQICSSPIESPLHLVANVKTPDFTVPNCRGDMLFENSILVDK